MEKHQKVSSLKKRWLKSLAKLNTAKKQEAEAYRKYKEECQNE